ncbi:NAD(P)/FAD-dependent oxidoreductase [Actinoplanes sp. NPDC051513]|uniref:NAD(P)/FAD-dependent oxidoreductase n=1 Tax=Actinoplanes sp. NPDC051513 TaxID=3363908 RepID=UPI0037BBC510
MPAYDVIIVGARVAGAAAAMLLARQGLRVLVADRDRYGADTLSTHALMRGGVFLLSRWGVLDRVIEAGTPPVRQTRFDFGAESVTIGIKPAHGVDALYAPRRTVLDRALADAAEAAGADIRYGLSVTGLLRDDSGRIAGIHGRDRAGAAFTARARLTVGADGTRSIVAREAGATTLRAGAGCGAIVYGYWSQLCADGYEWFYRPGHSAGVIPTNADQVCVFAGVPAHRLVRGDLRATYHRLLAATTGGAGDRLAQARPPGRLHTWIGRPSYLRQAHGPGWALIGDAGSFLDPLSTHGITDALRDAEILARCFTRTGTVDDLDEFATVRSTMFDVVDRIAGYGWDLPQLRTHLLSLSAAMSTELELITNLVRK